MSDPPESSGNGRKRHVKPEKHWWRGERGRARPTPPTSNLRLGRLAQRRRVEAGLDPLEFFLGSLPYRALEPLVGREQVPPSEEEQGAADGERRVVDDVPVEVGLPRDSRGGDRHQEQH